MLVNLQDRLLLAIVGIFLLAVAPSAKSSLPYEQIPGQMQVEQADKDRVPQVELQTAHIFTMLKETDYRGEGQFPLELTRISISPRNTALDCVDSSMHWEHSYSSCLINNLSLPVNPSITVCTMGICTTFNANLKPYSGDVHDTLIKNGVVNGVTYPWVYTQFKTGIREAYDSKSRMVARFDRAGIEHRVTYQVVSPYYSTVREVTHMPSGRRLSFQYSSLQTLSSITDPAAQVFKYDFTNTASQLSTYTTDSITFPAADAASAPLVRTYLESGFSWECITEGGGDYVEGFLLNSVKEAGQTLLDVNYLCNIYTQITQAGHNAQNRIQKRAYNLNASARDLLTEQFADTDTSAYRSMVYDRQFGCVDCGLINTTYMYRPASVSARCAGCDADYKSYTYNSKGDMLTRTDYLNRVTKFTYDAKGLPLTETEAYGIPDARITTRTWDTRFPLKTSEVVGEVAKDWRYNDKGHVIREIIRPVSEALVNDACPINSKTCHQTNYNYVYDPTTHVTLKVTKTGPRPENGSTITEYRSNGDLWKITNALGQVDEVLAVNAHGQITQRRDINGQVTITDYNNLRQPTTITTGSDVTRYNYYTNGRLKTLTRPDGSVLFYTYTPAGSVKTVSSTNNGITETVEYQRDSRGNILNTIASRTGDTAQTWKQTFDNKGLLATQSDGSTGWSKTLSYNLNNLPTQSCLSAQICDLTGYTGLDQVNDRSKAPMLSNGTLGTATPLFSLDYDVAGRVKQIVDPNNARSTLTNNELSKHTDENSPDFGDRSATYDLAGNNTYQQDSDGNSATKQYDA